MQGGSLISHAQMKHETKVLLTLLKFIPSLKNVHDKNNKVFGSLPPPLLSISHSLLLVPYFFLSICHSMFVVGGVDNVRRFVASLPLPQPSPYKPKVGITSLQEWLSALIVLGV